MQNQAASDMEKMMGDLLPKEKIKDFLLRLREKGETVDDVTACTEVMRKHAVKFSITYPDALDTCGTGGDSKNTINISTLSALVIAAAGAKVAKHGNRSISSACGSADLLEALGVKIDTNLKVPINCLEKTNFGFFFAPLFHPAVKYAMEARREIQGKTIFNILGPLSNPAGAEFQIIGVYEKRLLDLMANVLKNLGSKKALIVHSKDGMDEISISDETQVAELSDGKIKTYTIKPEDFGLKRASMQAIQTHSKEESKKMALSVLKDPTKTAASDIVALNAGAGLYAANKAASIQEGVRLAVKTLEEGKAAAKLEEIIRVTNA